MSESGFDLLQAQRRIFRSALGAYARLVALALCDHWSKEQPQPFPSVDRLAGWTALERKTVMRAIAELRAAGAVGVITKGNGCRNRYDLVPLMRLPVPHTDQSLTRTSPSPVHDRSLPGTATSPSQGPEGTNKEPIKEPKGDALEESQPMKAVESAPNPKPKRREKRPETAMPADWQPTEAHRELARTHSLELLLEVQAFRAHAESKARTAVSWNGAFTTWLVNQVRWNKRDQQRSPRRLPTPQRGVVDEAVAATWGQGDDTPLAKASGDRE